MMASATPASRIPGSVSKVWHDADGQTWIGYCVNRTTGDYKGWPIDDGERRAVFG